MKFPIYPIEMRLYINSRAMYYLLCIQWKYPQHTKQQTHIYLFIRML